MRSFPTQVILSMPEIRWLMMGDFKMVITWSPPRPRRLRRAATSTAASRNIIEHIMPSHAILRGDTLVSFITNLSIRQRCFTSAQISPPPPGTQPTSANSYMTPRHSFLLAINARLISTTRNCFNVDMLAPAFPLYFIVRAPSSLFCGDIHCRYQL